MVLNIRHLIIALVVAVFLGYGYSDPSGVVFAESSSNKHNPRPGTQKAFVPRDAQSRVYINVNFNKYRVGNLWGLYNDNGIIAYPQFDEIKELDLSRCAVKKNGKWGAMDKYGNVDISIEWDSIDTLGSSYYKIEKNGYYGIVNNSGTVLQSPIYTYVGKITDDKGKLFSVCKRTGCGIIDKEGGIFMPLTQEGPLGSILGVKYVFSIQKNNLYGLVDIYGNKVANYRYPGFLSGGCSVIFTTNSKYKGLAAAHEDREIVSPMFENIVALSQEGYYKVKSDSKWGVVSYDGEFIYPIKYGTFEINRMMNKYSGKNYEEVYNYNYYYSMLLEAYYNLLYYGNTHKKTKEAFEKVMENDNKYTDLKQRARELMQKNGIKI